MDLITWTVIHGWNRDGSVCPQNLPEDAPVLVLLPGLTGGSHDTYVQHMVSRARAVGIRCAHHCFSNLLAWLAITGVDIIPSRALLLQRSGVVSREENAESSMTIFADGYELLSVNPTDQAWNRGVIRRRIKVDQPADEYAL